MDEPKNLNLKMLYWNYAPSSCELKSTTWVIYL